MKLSLPLIAKRLDFPAASALPEEASTELLLPRPVFYTGETVLRADTLYLCRGVDLPARISPEEGSALICIGLPEKTASDKVLTNILILDGRVDIFKLHNAVNEIYDQYEEWEEALSRIIQSAETDSIPEKLLQASEAIFGQNLLLLDPDQKVVAGTSPLARTVPSEKLAEMMQAKEVLSEDITRGGLLLYRLLLLPDTQTAAKEEAALLPVLAQYYERFLRMETGGQNAGDPELSTLFIAAIDAGHLSKKTLDSELKKRNRLAQGRFYLFCLLPDLQSDASAAGFFCGELLREMPKLLAFLYKDSVIVIAEEDYLSKELIRQHLIHFARENNYRMGQSNPFQSLYDIRTYYRQAKTALDIGLAELPKEWFYPFSAITLDYFFRKAEEEFAPEELLSPIFYRLMDYDAKNNTDYLDTLKAYLRNNQNAVQTAKELFIHRGTILYRIKRICEIGETDLSDPDELLHLYLSMRMMRQAEERKES